MFENSTESFSVWAFALSYALWAALPGPNFVIVANAGLQGPRLAAAMTALGVAAGASLHAFAAVAGFGEITTGEAARHAATVVFACLLIYTGVAAASRAVSPAVPATTASPLPSAPHFGLGFLTALANPMTAIFFTSSVLKLEQPAGEGALAAAPVLVFVIAASWFVLVGLGASLEPVQRAYLRGRRGIDIAAGLCLMAVGLIALAGLLQG